jgi:hypothetical protein
MIAEGVTDRDATARCADRVGVTAFEAQDSDFDERTWVDAPRDLQKQAR